MVEARINKAQWLAGPASAVLFCVCVIGFAAARDDGYSHATKAVSELGSLDAPAALAFNLLGFIAPGLLIVLFSVALLRDARARTGPYLLFGSGLMFMLAGLAPADLENHTATTTQVHALGAMGSGFLWVFALFWLGPMLRHDFGLDIWGRLTPWFASFLFANIGWQVAFQATGAVMPGWGQRIGLFGYFLWIAVTGFVLWHSASKRRNPHMAQSTARH